MKFMVNRRARRAGIAALAAVAIGLSVPATATSAFAADPVDGAPSIGDSLFPGIGNGGYDVDHYDVNLSFAFPNTITAVTTITATAQSPLKSFSLDFEGLTVSSVKVNGVAAQYTRTADLPNSAHKLRIRPSKTLPAGKFTVEVAYAGTPSTHTDPDGSQEGWVQTPDGATALGQPVGTMAWIPSNNTPADKATYRFSYTIPTQLDGVDLAAAGNGELISKTPSEDGTTTWIWDQRQQMSTMATFVSIGKYLTYDSEITLSSGKTIKEWSFVDPTVTANNQATIQTRRGQLKTMLDFLESKYGPYPGNSTGIVVDITSLGYALETQDRPYFERSVSESTLIHELAHQWFGDGISPRDWNHIWLSEGMATFAEAMWTEQKGGTNAVTAQYNRWNSTAVTSSLWTPAPAHMTSGAQLFNSPVYTRGAMAWGALKEALGAEKFGNLIKEWNAEHNGTSQTTVELQALAERIAGRSLTDLFDTWVYTDGKPTAWPATWELSLAGNPAGGEVAVGDTVHYTLSAKPTGRSAITNGEATLDVTDLLKSASIDTESLPAGLTLSGNELKWAVPTTALNTVSSVEFAAKVNPGASSASFALDVRSSDIGETTISEPVVYSTPDAVASITAAVRGGESSTGWYAQDVTVDFDCAISGGEFETDCPEPVLVSSATPTTVSGSVTDKAGITYTATSPSIGIDKAKPTLTITGVKAGATYSGVGPKPSCKASDALSGLAGSCALTIKRTPTSVKVTATATDKVGNASSASVSYKTRAVSLPGAKLKGSVYRVKSGKKYQLVALTTGSQAPRYLAPKSGKTPKGKGVAMKSAGIVDGVHVWKLTVKAKAPKHGTYKAGVRIAGKVTTIKMHR